MLEKRKNATLGLMEQLRAWFVKKGRKRDYIPPLLEQVRDDAAKGSSDYSPVGALGRLVRVKKSICPNILKCV